MLRRTFLSVCFGGVGLLMGRRHDFEALAAADKDGFGAAPPIDSLPPIAASELEIEGACRYHHRRHRRWFRFRRYRRRYRHYGWRGRHRRFRTGRSFSPLPQAGSPPAAGGSSAAPKLQFQ